MTSSIGELSRPQGEHDMKRISMNAVLAQTDFIVMNTLGKALITLVVLVSVLNAVFLPVTGFEPEATKGTEVFLGVIYTLIAALMLTGIADEIGTGQAMIYLVQPITKREYIAAWLLAGPALLGVSYVAAILIPALVLSPRLITKPTIYEPVIYTLGELLYIALLTLLLSLLLRNKSRAVFAVLSFMFLIPALGILILGILSSMFGLHISNKVLAIFTTIFHPAAVIFENDSMTKLFGLLYSYGGSAALVALLLKYSERIEV